MRVLLAQLDPAPGDPGANAATIAATLADHPEAQLAVFPELFLTGYDLERVLALALVPPDAATAAGDAVAAARAPRAADPFATICEAARRHRTALLVGFPELTIDGGVANALACIDADGRHVATYRKANLFAAEAAAFVAGDELLVVELAGHRIGLLTCFDVEFPEPARLLARAGAQLLVTVAANMEPYGPDHALAARARALDNRLPHVYVNRVGSEAGLRFVGGSAVLAPDGSPIAQLDRDAGAAGTEAPGSAAAAVRVVEIPLGVAAKPQVNYLEHLRDDLVAKVVSSPSVTGGTP
ncbi:nitrilase-related carbon-nitrogen hydrolase [Conexibacter sp. CPCC 206217]|uniref:nitrilase-related carbon-nitrogen hydrolase n=1 Tax=Conexibacter sp. CPCC 206217 TaxID=3064574 RepID=UPI002728186C|nr:nitrilase-related carbon-nitrogen hydrolase [Conexibacter sp. CPCC 206217]MDO8211822.1 nitrilase-related carbon-nitrogen hydrolase [Conexibacter sp. CPCC 206217]